MNMPYQEPELDRKAFNCPFCNAYANFLWSDVVGCAGEIPYKAARCTHCEKWTIWVVHWVRSQLGAVQLGTLVYPPKLTSPLPHQDLPESCKSDYEEARQVLPFSPRGAAALLRLCIQKLCVELGEKGENINHDIGQLVKNGLDPKIQKALDAVRVTGNNAVHPGEMDLKDDAELVNRLFKAVNLIVEDMITKPKEIDELYQTLPPKAREGINKRDA